MNVANSQTVTIREINPTNSNIDSTGGRVNHLGRATNNILYAASEFGGLFKSTDAGRSWVRLDAHLPTRTMSVEASPANPNLVIATSLYDGRVNSLAGINISRDGGVTWSKPLSTRPPSGFCSNSPNVNEPSAFGIAFDPQNAAHIFVGTNCGLAKSTDGGLNWTFINPGLAVITPFPAARAVGVVDVVVHHGGIIDTCGFDGHRRSTDGGVRWVGAASGGIPLPAGICSIAVSPDESSVLFATVGTKIFETDNGGGSWNTEFVNPRPQGHVPFVVTNKRQGRNFDLWFGDVLLYRARCVTPITPGPDARCPPSGAWTKSGTGAHPDMGNVVFTDPTRFNLTACRRDCTNAETSCESDCDESLASCMSHVGEPGEPLASQCNQSASRCRAKCTSDLNACNTNCNRPREGCPFVLSNDGGTVINTVTEPPACHTPKWIESEVPPRGLWLWSLNGANIPNSRIREALYMGAQDNGPFATLDAGAATPNWTHLGIGDSFDVAADSTQVVHSDCCFGSPRDNQVFRRNPGMTGGGQIPNYPPGLVPRFFFPDVIARFGANRYAMVTTKGIFATQNISATPIGWTSLGTNTPTNACGLWAAGPQSNPTFFAVTGFCAGFFGDLLRYNGTSATQTWQKVPLPSGSFGVGVFAVDPNNPNRLFVSVFNSTGQNMFRTANGGITWTADPALDSLMTSAGAFQLTVTNAGTLPYTQPTLVAFDPNNTNNLVAGAADAGIFLSRNNGATWTTLTNNSGDVANPVIPRPHWAYFDRECSQYNIYVGTQGRGAWRFSYRDTEGTTVSSCQARCDSSLPECQSRCDEVHAECLAETGPNKTPPFQCAAARNTCRASCITNRNVCRQRCVDCPE
jgi:photosystem II stability/assembly factor-like uncharacterized protein